MSPLSAAASSSSSMLVPYQLQASSTVPVSKLSSEQQEKASTQLTTNTCIATHNLSYPLTGQLARVPMTVLGCLGRLLTVDEIVSLQQTCRGFNHRRVQLYSGTRNGPNDLYPGRGDLVIKLLGKANNDISSLPEGDRSLLKAIGSTILSLDDVLKDLTASQMKQIAAFFPKLNKLNATFASNVAVKALKPLIGAMKKLEVDFSQSSDSVKKAVVMLLKDAKQLQVVKFDWLSLPHLLRARTTSSSLTSLTLNNCAGLNPKTMSQLVRTHPQLEEVDLDDEDSDDDMDESVETFYPIAALTKLTTLDMHRPVDDNFMERLAVCRKLRILKLLAGDLTDSGIQAMEGLPLTTLVLKSIDTEKVSVEALRKLFISLSQLVEFESEHTTFEQLDGLSNCRELRKLSLECVFDLETEQAATVLTKLINLESLNLEQVTGMGAAALKALQSLSKLQYLSLNNTGINFKGVDPNWTLTHLTHLCITDSGGSTTLDEYTTDNMSFHAFCRFLNGCPHLETLHYEAYSCEEGFDDSWLKAISEHKNLRTIVVGGEHKATEEGIALLKSALRQAKITIEVIADGNASGSDNDTVED